MSERLSQSRLDIPPTTKQKPYFYTLSGVAVFVASRAWGLPPHGRSGQVRPCSVPCWRLAVRKRLRIVELVGVKPHTDSSNEEDYYRRNRVRHELLPLLRTFNPRVSEALVRLGQAATEQVQLVNALVEGHAGGEEPPDIVLVSHLGSLPPAIRYERLARAYERAAGTRRGLSARHIAALEGLTRGRGERSLSLPWGVRASVRSGKISFGPAPVRKPPEAPEPLSEARLFLSTVTRVGMWEFHAELADLAEELPEGCLSIWLDSTSSERELSVRPRRPGDRLRTAGMVGRKKIQDIFVNAGIPRRLRDDIPLVCVETDIVWAVGVRLGEAAVGNRGQDLGSG